MSRTRGEGRSSAEKSGRIVEDPQATRQRRARRKAEEKAWADKSGPVEVRKIQ